MRRGLAPALGLALLATACPADAPTPAPRGQAATEAPTPSVVAPSPTAAPPAGQPEPERYRGDLERVATLDQPLALSVRADDPALYVAEKTGAVMAVRDGRVDPRPVLDLRREVSQGSEQGLLGLAFSPGGRFLYVNHTDLEGHTHVTEFEMRGGRAAARSRREVLFVEQPYSNHNGGNLVFGPDGYLYVGLGDGGSAGDPEDRAQDLGSLLGKMVRIDPRPRGSRPYRVPPDNPFAQRAGARPEIWAFGLRNPWRYSFDRLTGDLWIGDVGQDRREEIDLEPAGSGGGRNYGWNGYEGNLVFEQPVPENAIPPVLAYGGERGSSVIGGYVYRGAAIPELQGAYLFADFFNPVIRALVPDDPGYREVSLDLTVDNLASFGEDAAGELYALSLSGPVYRLT